MFRQFVPLIGKAQPRLSIVVTSRFRRQLPAFVGVALESFGIRLGQGTSSPLQSGDKARVPRDMAFEATGRRQHFPLDACLARLPQSGGWDLGNSKIRLRAVAPKVAARR